MQPISPSFYLVMIVSIGFDVAQYAYLIERLPHLKTCYTHQNSLSQILGIVMSAEGKKVVGPETGESVLAVKPPADKKAENDPAEAAPASSKGAETSSGTGKQQQSVPEQKQDLSAQNTVQAQESPQAQPQPKP